MNRDMFQPVISRWKQEVDALEHEVWEITLRHAIDGQELESKQSLATIQVKTNQLQMALAELEEFLSRT